METRRVSDIVFRDDLYPRIAKEPALVQRYAENLEVMPPIEVNQNNILIDGWHRWTAHRKNNIESINVTVTKTESELKLFALSILRNASHGLQLTEKDKSETAKRLYNSGNGLTKDDIAKTISVSARMVNNYLHDVDKQLKEQRKQTIYDMWLSCHTQEEIAEAVNISRDQVQTQIEELCNLEVFPKSTKLSALFQDDFEIPLYSVWRFNPKTNSVSHFGNSEQKILENLLYLYTEPFDIVLDPFAGGGATIDICKKRLRRYWSSDRKPIVERETEIRCLDICQELPPLTNRWSKVTLTYLDSPYWKQAENKYSKDADDLANMTIDDFMDKLSGVINNIAEKQSKGVIAMLMQPTQWNAPRREVVDHIIDVINAVTSKKLTLKYRISCPYQTEQYNAQQVTWAKENKELLVITRELVIWRVNV